jgi:hypothetical protein
MGKILVQYSSLRHSFEANCGMNAANFFIMEAVIPRNLGSLYKNCIICSLKMERIL